MVAGKPETCESLFILLLHFVLLCLDLPDNLCVVGIVSFIPAAMAFFCVPTRNLISFTWNFRN